MSSFLGRQFYRSTLYVQIISIRKKYLKQYDSLWIICIRKEYLTLFNSLQIISIRDELLKSYNCVQIKIIRNIWNHILYMENQLISILKKPLFFK